MRNKLLRLLALLAIIITSFFLVTRNEETSITQDLSQRPQFYMKGFTQWVTDEQGVINTKLSGDSLDLFTKKDYAIIKNPKLVTNLQMQQQWHLSASHAQGFNNKIFLSGKVHAESTHDNKTFDTNTLWLHHKTGFGTTEDKVTIKSGIMHSTGTGAEFQSQTGEIKLLADTFTTYESTKKKPPHE